MATELNFKRLIVGGLERVYELVKDFRSEGDSRRAHRSWYGARVGYLDTMERIENTLEHVTRKAPGHGPNPVDLRAAPPSAGSTCNK